jgi:hypothetical protein
MRTTLTLEPDVAERLKARMRTGNLTLKETVNRALRAGLAVEDRRGPEKRFRVKPHHCGGLLPGIDGDKISQVLDEMEVEEFARRLRR